MGDLKFNRNRIFQGREIKASEIAGRIPPEDRKLVEMGGRLQHYMGTMHIAEVKHGVCLGIFWNPPNDAKPAKMHVTG